MAVTNQQRVGKGLDVLRDAMVPFVERALTATYGDRWRSAIAGDGFDARSSPVGVRTVQWDAHRLLGVMWDHWNEVFRRFLGPAERTLVSELRDVRNRWAHQNPFNWDDAYRALDSMQRLLAAVSAPEAQELDQMKQEVLRVRYADQARQERRKAAGAATEGQPASGLEPWRQVISPHPDVASGNYQNAEFAADLAQVYRGEGTSEYRDPGEFFRRTFLTVGLRQLLTTAVQRIGGTGGDPVVELQTNFGGGKTHSMLALYHLFSGLPPSQMPEVESLLSDLKVDKLPATRRAVLVGQALNPAQSHRKPDGTETCTFWGEMAWQLGGAEGYGMVAEADRRGVSPGSNLLADLFRRFSPCLVLIDEWIAYVRMLYHVNDLPAGSFDANLTFAQALTEAARQVPGTLVVASIPASDIEVGGEAGQAALSRLRNVFGRLEAAWRPASSEEGFEIVRRRLFEPINDAAKFRQRDAVIGEFLRLYRGHHQDFPPGVGEGDFERRMQAAYPIHPELFDRLYKDWSSLERFQRTRGVLRLMAAVIHALWERGDGNLMILPGTVPIDEPQVSFELTRYLEDNWIPVLETDVDGQSSLPLKLDRENPNLGRYSACRRVARTIYLGSAPTVRTQHPGIEERNVKLGCVQPGENVAIFGDAIRRLTDQATHMYVDGRRYWLSTQPSVTRMAQDRARLLDEHVVWEELRRRLRADRVKGDFAGVHPVPASSQEVPDEQEVRLVILAPQHSHSRQDERSPARAWAAEVLAQRGGGPRIHRNMLIFLAPEQARLVELEEALRHLLAWDSICSDAEALDLTPFQRKQAQAKRKQFDETVEQRIPEAYCWLMVPLQTDPLAPVSWEESRLSGSEPLAVRASKKLLNDSQLYVKFGGALLRMALDQYLWADRPHVGLKQLWSYFSTYLYLPRLKDASVLTASIENGLAELTWHDFFAYAQAFDESKKRYVGLRTGILSVHLDEKNVLVQPEAAQSQMDEDEAKKPVRKEDGSLTGKREGADMTRDGPTPADPPRAPVLTRFHATVRLDPLRVSRDTDQIAREVLAHLSSLTEAEVTINLEIEGHLPEGFSDALVRTVNENCRTLRFQHFAFEEE